MKMYWNIIKRILTGTDIANVGSSVETSNFKSNTLWMTLHKGPQNSCTFDIPATNICRIDWNLIFLNNLTLDWRGRCGRSLPSSAPPPRPRGTRTSPRTPTRPCRPCQSATPAPRRTRARPPAPWWRRACRGSSSRPTRRGSRADPPPRRWPAAAANQECARVDQSQLTW